MNANNCITLPGGSTIFNFDNLFLETTKAIVTKGRGVNGKMLKKYILKDMFLPYYKKWLVEREIKKTNENKIERTFFIIKVL